MAHVTLRCLACSCACICALLWALSAIVALILLLSTGFVVPPLVGTLGVLTKLTGLEVASLAFTFWSLKSPGYSPSVEKGHARPNIVIYLCDDMGYADPSVFGLHVWGRSNNTTPRMDALAQQGLMLTQFLTEPICTPARAALLTGRYAHRSGMSGDTLPQRVLYTPGAAAGLPRREMTLATALKAAGYRTAMSGKWHLGVSARPTPTPWLTLRKHTNAFMPVEHGFDDSLVFPFSNMPRCTPYQGQGDGLAESGAFCYLVGNNTIVQQPSNMFRISEALVSHATRFISRAVDDGAPFLVYFSDLHPHTPLFTSPAFGPGPPGPFQSSNGQYGQVLRELDANIGALMDVLDQKSVAEKTLFILYVPHRGSGRPTAPAHPMVPCAAHPTTGPTPRRATRWQVAVAGSKGPRARCATPGSDEDRMR